MFGQNEPDVDILECSVVTDNRKQWRKFTMPTVEDISVRKPNDTEMTECQTWPIWTCGVSEFEWEYTQTEKCLIIEGCVTVSDTPDSGKSVSFGPGDFVTLPNRLKCFWKVTEPVKKHYDFE
jgi:uncharacterized cupin superfamily protein